ncbi:MAG: hypothetical protein KME28_25915 [Pelatocladus maniniholoensis HA4357-MV3]|jgi:hypothetical protein|uniref:Uncharacterized protein n=1 Tax=Pelatocladus maniniholoensis HA4357-MV3 TaxID=1117104 RepID=A0A9E3HD80_9NOST|nr:hypothetical protein [Pelatocladus maniniholoensis HA4357-MV3]
MPVKRSISILAISALMVLPAGIATAGDIDIQNGNSRVIVDTNNGITIRNNSRPTTSVYPLRLPNSRVRVQKNGIYTVPTVKVPNNTRSYCSGRTWSQQSVQSSNNGHNRTYSSTTTSTCK